MVGEERVIRVRLFKTTVSQSSLANQLLGFWLSQISFIQNIWFGHHHNFIPMWTSIVCLNHCRCVGYKVLQPSRCSRSPSYTLDTLWVNFSCHNRSITSLLLMPIINAASLSNQGLVIIHVMWFLQTPNIIIKNMPSLIILAQLLEKEKSNLQISHFLLQISPLIPYHKCVTLYTIRIANECIHLLPLGPNLFFSSSCFRYSTNIQKLTHDDKMASLNATPHVATFQ